MQEKEQNTNKQESQTPKNKQKKPKSRNWLGKKAVEEEMELVRLTYYVCSFPAPGVKLLERKYYLPLPITEMPFGLEEELFPINRGKQSCLSILSLWKPSRLCLWPSKPFLPQIPLCLMSQNFVGFIAVLRPSPLFGLWKRTCSC